MNNNNSLQRFQEFSISNQLKKNLKGGGDKFKNLLSTHLNLAKARKDNNSNDVAAYRDDLDCLEYASLSSCCGNGLGLW